MNINLLDPAPAKVPVQQLLAHDHVYATSMLMLCWDQWGSEFTRWHPETIHMEVDQTFGATVSKGNFDRLMAGITILTTDLFFKNVHRFVHLCDILWGGEFDPTNVEIASVAECAWGITESLLLIPPEGEDAEPFSDEVRHYLGHILHEEGYVTAPDVMKIALGTKSMEQVHAQHGHDPELMQAIHKNQQTKTKEIEEMLRAGLTNLFEQICQLPLRHGKVAELEQRLQRLRAII